MPKKLTQEEFIEKAIAKHGDEFDYSKVKYVNARTKIEILCKTHGPFLQTPNAHLMGVKCFKCYGTEKLTNETFSQKANIVHNNKFDYSDCKYVNCDTKVNIICPFHGGFLQKPKDHLYGRGCPQCGIIKCSSGKKITTEGFIERAYIVHGDRYNYDKVNVVHSQKKVIITCKSHGDFLQTPSGHLFGYGCDFCGPRTRMTTDEFKIKGSEKHNNLYDYSQVEYVTSIDKVKINCLIHGTFLQVPSSHLMGAGCPKCAGICKLTTEEFIERAENIHGKTYVYDKSIYVDAKTKVEIECKKHGMFLQTANSHLMGVGCPTCRHSKGELKIREILENKNIQYTPQKRFPDCKDIKPLAFDFYAPNLNLCIEFDGRQHFEVVEYFGGEKAFKITQKRDEIKNKYCRDNNIKLLRIRYDQDIIEILDKELNG